MAVFAAALVVVLGLELRAKVRGRAHRRQRPRDDLRRMLPIDCECGRRPHSICPPIGSRPSAARRVLERPQELFGRHSSFGQESQGSWSRPRRVLTRCAPLEERAFHGRRPASGANRCSRSPGEGATGSLRVDSDCHVAPQQRASRSVVPVGPCLV